MLFFFSSVRLANIVKNLVILERYKTGVKNITRCRTLLPEKLPYMLINFLFIY